jgi:hypothetical protein
VAITIRIAPSVKVVPNEVTLRDGEKGTLECVVQGNYGDFKVLWKDEWDIHAIKVT